MLKESKLADADAALYRDGDDVKALWNESASMGLEERIALTKSVLAEHNRADHVRRDEALAAITEGMDAVRRAMAAQRQYDRMTVKRVTAIKGAAGKEDTSAQVQKVMDLMVEKKRRLCCGLQHSLRCIYGVWLTSCRPCRPCRERPWAFRASLPSCRR